MQKRIVLKKTTKIGIEIHNFFIKKASIVIESGQACIVFPKRKSNNVS